MRRKDVTSPPGTPGQSVLPSLAGTASSSGQLTQAGHGGWRRLTGRFGSILGDRPGTGRLLLVTLLMLYGVVVVRTAWVSDDAMITLRTVDNLVHGYGLRWNVAERVQTYTHPLWMLLETIPYAITRSPDATLLFLGAVFSVLTVLILTFRLARDSERACLAILVLILSKAFVDYSTSGLENPLSHALLVALLLALRQREQTGGGWSRPALLGGLLVVNRMDLVLLIGPIVAASAWRRRGLWNWRVLLAGLGPLLAWWIFATWYYGSPVPNTALAKLRTGIPEPDLLAQGARYLLESLRHDPLTLTTIGLGVTCALVRRAPLDLGVAAGIGLHLAYVVYVGGDFMSGRFLTPALVASVTLIVWNDWPPPGWARRPVFPIVIALGLIPAHPTILSGTSCGLDRKALVDPAGIADERGHYYPWTGLFGPAHTRMASAFFPDLAGYRARAKQDPLLMDGAIGYLGFAAGPRVHILDYHALADPLLSRLRVVECDSLYGTFLKQAAGVKDAPPWRIGHFRREVPSGYVSSLLTGENQLVDPELRRLYDDIRLASRGSLWSAERLRPIWRLSLGLSNPSASCLSRHRDAWLPWAEVTSTRPAWARGHAYRGRYEISMGRPAAAIPHLVQATDLDSTDALPWELLGQAYIAQSNDEMAAVCSAEALALDPNSSTANKNLGALYNRLGRFAEAIPLLERARDMDPRSATVCYNLAVADAQLGRFEPAGELFDRSVTLDPNFTPSWYQGALVHAQRGEDKRAVRMLEVVVARMPENADAWLSLGDLSQRGGKRAKAEEFWRRAARLGSSAARDRLASTAPGK
jgi:arabinofuranosyltransferase